MCRLAICSLTYTTIVFFSFLQPNPAIDRALLNAQTLHAIDPSQLNVFFHTLILVNAMLVDPFCKTIERSQNKIWRYKRIEANPTYFIIIRNVIPLQSPRHVRPHSVLLLA